jgi:acyl-CoA reductase-like NAD-dependent aldehyde dehydrogenase
MQPALTPTSHEQLPERIVAARDAQREWAKKPIRQRLAVFKRFRGQLAERGRWIAEELLKKSLTRSNVAETLSSEVVPLADAARFLEEHAERLLCDEKLGMRGRALWLTGVSSVVKREPHGLVLIIAAGNYPLFLLGVQVLQALSAGNAVVLKPGKTGLAAASWLGSLLLEAGLPSELLILTQESVACANAALDAGVDKVVLTGSVKSGRAVLARCAETITPATVELSGCDAVYVLASADVTMSAKAVAFGLRLNGSATCIAPRRVLVHRAVGELFTRKLVDEVRAIEPLRIAPEPAHQGDMLIASALSRGARLLAGSTLSGSRKPVVITDLKEDDELYRTDLFAPLASVTVCDDIEHMRYLDKRCPYRLGASIFGDAAEAQRLAERIDAGFICINDLIVPTADARLPFGGRGDSGFGTTRGAEGLLEMTRIKVVSTRNGTFRPHYDAPTSGGDADVFDAYLQSMHGPRWHERLIAGFELLNGLRKLKRPAQPPLPDAPDQETQP